jgi:hypothetical protein
MSCSEGLSRCPGPTPAGRIDHHLSTIRSDSIRKYGARSHRFSLASGIKLAIATRLSLFVAFGAIVERFGLGILRIQNRGRIVHDPPCPSRPSSFAGKEDCDRCEREAEQVELQEMPASLIRRSVVRPIFTCRRYPRHQGLGRLLDRLFHTLLPGLDLRRKDYSGRSWRPKSHPWRLRQRSYVSYFLRCESRTY